jgi:hypothetical protein
VLVQMVVDVLVDGVTVHAMFSSAGPGRGWKRRVMHVYPPLTK